MKRIVLSYHLINTLSAYDYWEKTCHATRYLTSRAMYTPNTKKAMKLCFEAHKNQTDKSGLPYVFMEVQL